MKYKGFYYYGDFEIPCNIANGWHWPEMLAMRKRRQRKGRNQSIPKKLHALSKAIEHMRRQSLPGLF